MREKFGHRDIKSRGAYIESCEANIRFGFCQPWYLKDLLVIVFYLWRDWFFEKLP